MSLNNKETPMLHRFWKTVGGILIEEFIAIKANNKKTHGTRRIDGVIIKGNDFSIKKQSEVDIENKDIIVVQVKAARLGMNLMGQTLFSSELMKKFNPKSIEAIALCKADDDELRPLLEKFENVKVVVDTD